MSLQRRLVMLLALLAATVAINFAAAIWSIQFLESEIRQPLASVQAVMGRLASVKHALGAQGRILAPLGEEAASETRRRLPPVEPDLSDPRLEPHARFALLQTHVRARLRELESSPALFVRSGLSGPRAIRERAETAYAHAQHWFNDDDAEARTHAAMELHNLQQTIEWIESRIIEDVGTTAAFGADMRTRILLMFTTGAAALALTGWLAVGLVRRWVVLPVRGLQQAAVRFASGDLGYRVQVAGGGELADLARDINHMAGTIAHMHAERVERERLAAIGEVARRIVHNLRNPLAGIRTLAELTHTSLPQGHELREHQGRIIASVDRFESWLGDVLRVTRPLEIRPAPIAVSSWLRATIEALRPAAEAAGVSIEDDLTKAPSEVHADPRHLEQAVVALVTNAIEATPRGGRIRIVASQGPSDNSWHLRVRDDGSGVPEELRGRIFRPYFTTKPGGSGIGLAMVRQIVEGHGGTVRVESSSAGSSGRSGAEFVLSLPMSPPQTTGQIPPDGDQSWPQS